MNKLCIGCGSILQTTNKEEKGYTPDLKNSYCMRCFRLKNYGEKKKEDYISNKDIFVKINSKKGLVFFLIDFLNLNTETISIFKNIKLPKVLLVSKSDLMRPDMKPVKIKAWLKSVYNLKDDIYFISGKTNFSEINIFKYLATHNYQTGFIMGITNAGKSTFMNHILKEHHLKREVVVSKYQNTTLDFLKFKIEGFNIYDTPGFIYNTLSLDLLNTEIKPISLNLTKPTTIIISDKYYFCFPSPNQIILYINTKEYSKIFEKRDGNKLNVSSNSDLILPGIGFINIKKETSLISNLNNLEVRPNYSNYGGNYE